MLHEPPRITELHPILGALLLYVLLIFAAQCALHQAGLVEPAKKSWANAPDASLAAPAPPQKQKKPKKQAKQKAPQGQMLLWGE